jgi:hypothetical protein
METITAKGRTYQENLPGEQGIPGLSILRYMEHEGLIIACDIGTESCASGASTMICVQNLLGFTIVEGKRGLATSTAMSGQGSFPAWRTVTKNSKQ